MAEASISVDQDQFNCPVCLDLLTDPVTIHCGHSFCIVCINDCWDQEDKSEVYSCPQCRDTFTPRPVLRRNNMLAEVMEKLKKNRSHTSTTDHCYAGPGDVECDFCTGKKRKSVKSCLVCLVSLCERHLKLHLELPGLKTHTLVNASTKLHEKICSQHDEVLKIYCRTDQSCICCLCMMDEHKGHNTVTAKAERTEKQKKLKEEQRTSQQIIQEKQKKVEELKEAVVIIMNCAQAAVEENDRVFTELINSLEKKRSEVAEQIRNQETSELNRAKRLMKQLEQEIVDHKSRFTDLEQLSKTQDHIQFLQSFQPLCDSPGCEDSVSITSTEHFSFDGVKKSLLNLKKRLEEFCTTELDKICLHDFCCLTLDSNTAHRYFSLSENNKVLTWSGRDQEYSDHPERFASYAQVLCKESVSGRCYWEVEWSGKGGVSIAISYKGISRKGISASCVFGCNNHSWSLRCSTTSLSFWHNTTETKLSGPLSSKIGVYVDHSAGTLCFYSISKTMRLLHRVQTKFTQPLYAGFAITWGTLRLCHSQ